MKREEGEAGWHGPSEGSLGSMGHTEEAAGKTPPGVLVHLARILLACRLCWLLWQRQ